MSKQYKKHDILIAMHLIREKSPIDYEALKSKQLYLAYFPTGQYNITANKKEFILSGSCSSIPFAELELWVNRAVEDLREEGFTITIRSAKQCATGKN